MKTRQGVPRISATPADEYPAPHAAAMQHELFGTTSLTMLLDAGAREIAQSKAVCARAARLVQVTRELILRFHSHRVPPISGTSDASMPTPSYVWICPGQGSAMRARGRFRTRRRNS